MGFQNILLEIADGIATITMNRPRVLNALNRELLREFSLALDQVEQDGAVRVVVITGAGEKAFVAGADISEFKGMGAVEAHRFSQFVQAVFTKLERLRKPVIAAVNGYALGGGCELLLACDLVIAAAGAKIGQPEINLGVIPGAGGTQRLARLVGKQRAKAIVFTGDMIDAQEAYRIGLVNRVVPAADLRAEVRRICDRILAKGSVALQMAKEAINEGYDLDLDKGLAVEGKAWGLCFATEDKEEGVAAFLEKRQPVFKGR